MRAPIAAITGIAVAVLLVVVSARSFRTAASDELAIETVVIGAVELLTEACLESSHGDPAYPTALASYFSAATPDATRIAEQAALLSLEAPPDATLVAEYQAEVATAFAQQDPDYPAEYATLIAEGAWWATPDFDADFSVLDHALSMINGCQEFYGIVGHQAISGTVSVGSLDISVSGDDAEAYGVLSYSTVWTSDGTATPRSTANVQIPTRFTLRRESGGWRIVGQDSDLAGVLP